MTRLLAISSFVPTPTNIGGPTQLLYDLICLRPAGISLDLLVYSATAALEFDSRLRASTDHIRVEPPVRLDLFRRLVSFRLSGFRYPPPPDIDWGKYDLVWLYPGWMYPDFSRVPARLLISGMDSATLLYGRAMLRNPGYRIALSMLKLQQSLRLERSMTKRHTIHVVGARDRDVFRFMRNGVDCFYVRYPLGEHLPIPRAPSAAVSTIVVGMSGGYDRFYLGRFPDDLARALAQAPELVGKVSWYLTGRGWESFAAILRTAGFDVRCEIWVPNYLDFLAGIDVQLFPLIVGAGTKGKVLAAIASGVVPIGTSIAYDSILEGSPLSEIRTPPDVVRILREILQCPAVFFREAENHAQLVRRLHDPAESVASFWQCALSRCAGKS